MNIYPYMSWTPWTRKTKRWNKENKKKGEKKGFNHEQCINQEQKLLLHLVTSFLTKQGDCFEMIMFLPIWSLASSQESMLIHLTLTSSSAIIENYKITCLHNILQMTKILLFFFFKKMKSKTKNWVSFAQSNLLSQASELNNRK